MFAPEQVKDAFDDVVRAKEDKARIINLADAYRESILPNARGEAARLTEAAEAYKQERVAFAEGQSQRFLSILNEYELAPEVTRQRLFLEAMEEILPGVRKYIIDDDTGGGLIEFLDLTGGKRTPDITRQQELTRNATDEIPGNSSNHTSGHSRQSWDRNCSSW